MESLVMDAAFLQRPASNKALQLTARQHVSQVIVSVRLECCSRAAAEGRRSASLFILFLKGNTVKLMITLLAVVGFWLISATQTEQDIQRYAYHVWGTVLDEDSRPMPHLSVCFLPSERPINGRIPCTKTSDNGTFAMTVKDIPDKYNVCASTTDSPFIFVGEDPGHRVTCSKPMEFGSNDDCRKVDLKFETKKGQP